MQDGNPLLLQSRTQAEAAPLLYPPFQVPQPPALTQADRELTERSRFLQETLKYSGYYVVPSPSSTRLLQAHAMISTAFTPEAGPASTPFSPPVQQIYTPQLERYSDRYRKILGKKSFYDEIPNPNPYLFPPELLSSKHQIHSSSTFTSKVQFLSSRTLANEVARLVAASASVPVNQVGGERMDLSGSGGAAGADDERKDGLAGDEKENEEEEDEQAQEHQPESDQEEEGGDYVNDYADDDEDGGDAFGDDGDDGEYM